MDKIASVVGCGTIGAGWAARLVLSGWRVQAYDANPKFADTLKQSISQATEAWRSLHNPTGDIDSGVDAAVAEGQLVVCPNLAACLADTGFVIESLPEDLALKQRVYQDIEPLIATDTLLVSSTSGFKPTDLATVLNNPARFFVCHPFNPVYLIPLVEMVPHTSTSDSTRTSCQEWLQSLGMRTLLVRREIDGHIADRLLEAMWREALWLIHDDIATTAEIDDAIKHGFGLRMAHMGLFETYRLGGGEGGFAAFLEQFGPALKWPWSHLTDVPELDATLVNKIVEQSDAQTGTSTHVERVQDRDQRLVAILRALGSVR